MEDGLSFPSPIFHSPPSCSLEQYRLAEFPLNDLELAKVHRHMVGDELRHVADRWGDGADEFGAGLAHVGGREVTGPVDGGGAYLGELLQQLLLGGERSGVVIAACLL